MGKISKRVKYNDVSARERLYIAMYYKSVYEVEYLNGPI